LGRIKVRYEAIIADKRFESGGRVASFTLYHSGTWPRGMIGHVELLWQPTSEAPTTSTSGLRRTVWLRLHPAIFEEAYSAVKASIANHVLQRATAEDIVQMRDLRGEINAFEIMGPNAARVLRGVLTLCKVEKGVKRQVDMRQVTTDSSSGMSCHRSRPLAASPVALWRLCECTTLG
jgi:ribonuclease P/MRP protein subunit POP1